jgi:hypothetical protein
VLFDIPIIGLFEAVGFEHYTLHHAQNNNLLTQKNNNQARVCVDQAAWL